MAATCWSRCPIPEAFKVGETLATTKGHVIHETPLFQLIRYEPTTEKVYARPLLLIPPWINKYYILDLQPKSSLVKWLTDQGFAVYIVSWKNPREELRDGRHGHLCPRRRHPGDAQGGRAARQ